ncbi:glycosyltransferase family 2 protein [Lentisphaerae bacterium WC36]|nr:glycosyltransferase family 2 protein [Lentisphaerae bacterium WC36]
MDNKDKKDKLISIIVPMYNEEEVLESFYKRVKEVISKIEYSVELLFVNDGSSDNSLNIVRNLQKGDERIKYVDLSRNFGKELAMSAGFDYAQGDAAVVIDADLQDPPELILDMIKYWEAGYDDVYAKRISRKGETFMKKFTSKMFYRVLQFSSKVPIQKDTGDFRFLSKKALISLRELRETQRYTKGLFSLIGHKKKELLYERDPRIAGTTKWNYLKLIDLAVEGICCFTTVPLRLAIFLGLSVSFFSFIFMLVIIYQKLFGNAKIPPGYPSTMTVILFLGGIQLFSLGIIGEYLGRIFNETKNRPLYFINEYSDNKDIS